MILPYAKPINEKMREQLVKIWKKRKKDVSDFSTLSMDDQNTKKNHNLLCWYKNTQQ